MDTFAQAFHALTGNAPFPWQAALYERFVAADFPDACTLPTGLGKTSVVAVWLLALAANPTQVPRRLVYVVNRRTVVDQTTAEVEKYRKKLADGLPELRARLAALCATPTDVPLALSTLRGQFADNREWSADPARPAVVCGTVDMIGSRLLFSGYGCGFKTRPLHAGFLGQDALLVHDEAHLEEPFQRLVEAIRAEQTRCGEFRPFHVTALTATPRGGVLPFELTEAERTPPSVIPEPPTEPIHHVWRRLKAKKRLTTFTVGDEKQVVPKIVELAAKRGEEYPEAAILVFVRTVEAVGEVERGLRAKRVPAEGISVLTGTMRGLERDRQSDPRKDGADPVFARFLKQPKEGEYSWKVTPRRGVVYLICTAAGEVGVDISADHLICDLTPFDSMAQRFGRVNRYGDGDARLDIVHESGPSEKKKDDPFDQRRWLSLARLAELGGDASPLALGALPLADRVAAFTPTPTILPTSDILFDAWALTTPKELPGRPPVEEYLRGVVDEEQVETHVAWRAEVDLFDGTDVTEKALTDWLDDYPLRPHELLRDVTWRVQDELAELGEGPAAERPAWVVARDGTVTVTTLGELGRKDAKKKYVTNLVGRTVVLSPKAGGLSEQGTLSGGAAFRERQEYDVAGLAPQPSGAVLVRLVVKALEGAWVYELAGPVVGLTQKWELETDPPPIRAAELRDIRAECERVGLPPMRVGFRFDVRDPEDAGEKAFAYLVLKPEAKKAMKHPAAWPSLDGHNAGAKGFAGAIGAALTLPPDVATAVTLAAGWHDLGKDRGVWQRGAGNERGVAPVAKTLHGRPPENLNGFRHELASLTDIHFDPAFRPELDAAPAASRELLRHLIAAHHGRGRPHFPADEATDPERPEAWAAAVARETPGRYARLQRQFGRWGLAYLESLVRAADVLDSKRIEATPLGDADPGSWPRARPPFVPPPPPTEPTPTIRVAVDPTNPGQFFACCGLLELADRLWPGAEGWFAEGEFRIAGTGDLLDLLKKLSKAQLNSSLGDAGLKRLGSLLSANKSKLTTHDIADKERLRAAWQVERVYLSAPFNVSIDWWWDEESGVKLLKTWAAKQFVLEIARPMLAAIGTTDWAAEPVEACLNRQVKLSGLPFYFDSANNSQNTPRDSRPSSR